MINTKLQQKIAQQNQNCGYIGLTESVQSGDS